MARTRDVRKKQIVLYQGEASPYIYVVNGGLVKASVTHENGGTSIIAIFGPGDYFPHAVDPNEAPVSLFYYETMEDSQLDAYTMEEFNDYLASVPSFPQDAARRYIGALLHINALAQFTACEKLLHTLQYLITRFGEPTSSRSFVKISIQLTQQDIADLCNLSRETANLELNKLKNDEVIMINKKFYTVNKKALLKHIGDSGLEVLKF
jgi:CRP-like cAMP-binding protein